ncbi:MAG TPA: AAA family ATPase, partial [Acetobacteraceae bacterium]
MLAGKDTNAPPPRSIVPRHGEKPGLHSGSAVFGASSLCFSSKKKAHTLARPCALTVSGGSRQQLFTEFSRMGREAAFVDATRSPLGFVLRARHATVAALVDGVMEGKAFLALTGSPGVGKTTAASAICDELTRRSVRVLQVRRGADAGISLRTIASQVLDKAEPELDGDDIERLFDVMTARETHDQGFALIIDDAECLQADALGYLRLLALMAKDTMPQVVFVGDSSLWDTEFTVHSDLKAMITERWDLDGLTPDEARRFIELSVGSAAEAVFAPGGIDALVRGGEGSCGRIVSLLSLARALRVEQHDHWLTPVLIDAAAAMLDAGETGPLEGDGRLPDEGGHADPRMSVAAPEATPDPVRVGASADAAAIVGASFRARRVARMAGMTILLFVIATVASWQALVHISRTDARPAGISGTGAAAVPVQSTTDAATTSPVVLPDIHAQAVSPPAAVDAAVASPAPVVAATDTPALSAIAAPEAPAPMERSRAQLPVVRVAEVVGTTDAPTAPATTPPDPPAPSAEPQAPAPAMPATASVAATDTSTAPAITPPEPPAPTALPQVPAAAPVATTTETSTAPASASSEPPAPAAQPQTPVAATPAAPFATTTETSAVPATTSPEPPTPAAQPQTPVAATPATTTETSAAPAATPPEPPAPTAQPQVPAATPAAPVATSTESSAAPATTSPEPPAATVQAPETATPPAPVATTNET